MKCLLTDIDQCIFDYGSVITKFMKRLDYAPTKPINEIYNFAECFPNIKISLEDFGKSDEFENMDLFKDTFDGLNYFRNNGYEIICISAALNGDIYLEKRRNNFKSKLGFVPQIYHTDLRSKLDLLKKFPPSIWVDDLPENCDLGVEAGHLSFLMGYDYNKQSNHERIDNWNHLIQLIEH